MITVCIATFNGEKYIREQLNSILFQLSLQDEVIVSDDGSTDNTISIIKSFNDKRIKIIDGVHRHSPTLNFENALKEAKGDYIFLADQDDVWKDDKVKICLKWLQHYDCIISDAEVTDEKSENYITIALSINEHKKVEEYIISSIKTDIQGAAWHLQDE